MKRCTPAAAAASFSLILAVPALLLHLGADAAMAVFAAAAVSTAAAMALGVPWGEIEETILRVVADCIPTLLIVILVGMLVGIWMAGGTVPALLYYGVRLIAPGTLVPLAFLLCLLCAEFTGTSFGSVAAMGLTMAGIAATTSVPPALVAGAVVMALLSIPCNYFISYPVYSKFMPIDAILEMYRSIRPSSGRAIRCASSLAKET